MRVSFRVTILLLILSFLLTMPPALAQDGPLVLAFYYAWFDQNTWASGQSVDSPAEPYNSADRTTIERQVSQAQSAGIDAFVQSWYGPQEAGNQTETNFRTLLDVAQTRGFKAAVDLEVTSPFLGSASTVTEALAKLLATHAQHPAYLRFQGKPVIFFWRQQQFSVDQWATIRNQVDPNRATIWIAEGTDLAYLGVFDGHHLYSIAWAASPAEQLAQWGERVRAYAATNGLSRLWVATVMPGYDDTRLSRANTFALPRRNGDYYRETWQGAVASQPDMMIITSFNEWPEGTHLEPSVNYGNLYLDITRELVTALRGNPPPAPAPAPAVASTPTPEPVETPTGPYIVAEEGANIRSGPDTSFDRLGQLAANSPIAVIGKTATGDWWQINFPRGSDATGWVNAEVVTFTGDAEAVPVVEAPSSAEASSTARANLRASATATATLEVSAATPLVKIPAGGVNVRSGPGLGFDLLGRLNEGEEAVVVGKSETGEWWQIEYEDGQDGLAWVADAVVNFSGAAASVPIIVLGVPTSTPSTTPTSTVTPTPTPTEPIIAGTIEVTDPINVRAEPSTDGELLGGLYLGDKADVLAVSKDGDWWQIEFPGGPEGVGWVAIEFVRFQGDRQAVPIFGLGTITPTPRSTNTPTKTPTLTPPILGSPPPPSWPSVAPPILP
ncbi:MAG: SH3 domain-containing protein [Chloroflexi bacterium]|nr:SH3 domain-containing protein [Chloroflexota bacterium]